MKSRSLYIYDNSGEKQTNVVWFKTGKIEKEYYANVYKSADGKNVEKLTKISETSSTSGTTYNYGTSGTTTLSIYIDNNDSDNNSLTYNGGTYSSLTFDTTSNRIYASDAVIYDETTKTYKKVFYYIVIGDKRVEVDNYSTGQDSVVNALIPRLSTIKGELWYASNYGLPLFEKVTNKAIMDAVAVDIITSYTDTNQLISFDSTLDSKTRVYSCDFSITTSYTDEETRISLQNSSI